MNNENAINELRRRHPYPKNVFTGDLDDVVKIIPDKAQRTKITGILCRFGYDSAISKLELSDCETYEF